MRFLRYIFIIATCLLCNIVVAQNKPYRTASLDGRIHSLKVESGNGFMFPPVIRISTDDIVNISFDLFEEDHEDLSYSIIHCNANWQPSMLSSIEYIDGFEIQEVYDWALSFNTFQNYVNYRIRTPIHPGIFYVCATATPL